MTRRDAAELRERATLIADGLANDFYAIEQLEDDARKLAELVLAAVKERRV